MVIKIQGAKENNLKNIDVSIKDGLTVVTGISGSGKTSLVFDIVYKEARRRFLEAFSVNKEKLLLNPANVDSIAGLGPTIALEQNLLNRNPNSIVASATGLLPLFKILYSRFGQRKCHNCGNEIHYLKDDEIIDEIKGLLDQNSIEVYAVLVNKILGSHKTLIKLLRKNYPLTHIIVDGEEYNSKELDPNIHHTIQIKMELISKNASIKRIHEILTKIASLGAQSIVLKGKNIESSISRVPVCVNCGIWLRDLESSHFTHKCPYCKGTGCIKCNLTGLYPLASNVTWSKLLFNELLEKTIGETEKLFSNEYKISSNRLFYEISRRLKLLVKVGLDYLELNRSSPSLSRGESQRVRLAIVLLSELEDIIHILDEPTIGQHPLDIAHLLSVFTDLKGPVIYIEHDRQAAIAAHQVIDIGPGAGEKGGEITFIGTPLELWKANNITGEYFSLREEVYRPNARSPPDKFIRIKHAHLHNLKNIDVNIPINRLCVITGVSGSGKSTLIEQVLFKSLKKNQPIGCEEIEGPEVKVVMVNQDPIGKNPRSNPATYTKIADFIRKMYANKSKYSPTYFSFNTEAGACPNCKGMGAVEIKMRYLPSNWVTCSECEGRRFSDSILAQKIESGDNLLSIDELYDLSISKVNKIFQNELKLPKNDLTSLRRMLKALNDIGLGYLSIGQPSPILSGGEAQRIKLSKYLGKKSLEDKVILLDEPSTGLHPHDLNGFLMIIEELVNSGATVVIIEHNIDIIKSADWIIDLGPGSGPDGGKIIHQGPLEELLNNSKSLTAKALLAEKKLNPDDYDKGEKPLRTSHIQIQNAHIHNLKNVDVIIPKNKFIVVTGVSGSGKSSLIMNTIETEARRRYLETLSMYERQSTKEVSEALVDKITGLGVTALITPEKLMHGWILNVRHNIGRITDINLHLANLFAYVGELKCPECGTFMERKEMWICNKCNHSRSIAKPKHFISSNYSAACLTCNGVGSILVPNPSKLIIHPEKPLCQGAMYSPGFFPKGYLCKPFNGGYYVVQALASEFNFDPFKLPWNEMSKAAQEAFLYGSKKKIHVIYENKKGQTNERDLLFKGFYGEWLRDWDIGGTFSDRQTCKTCKGSKLRPEYLAVTLCGSNFHELSEISLEEIYNTLRKLSIEKNSMGFVNNSLKTILTKLEFLIKTGLNYVNLNRLVQTLSAGEAQRIRLAGLIGANLSNTTVLLDEPSRGLHPSELKSLIKVLKELRDRSNTIITIEHDPLFIENADYIIDIGPGAGIKGGRIVAEGTLEEVRKQKTITAEWLKGKRSFKVKKLNRKPKKWLKLYNATENNLKCDLLKIPLGLLVGICGVSGSGKSSLLIDTLGRILVPKKITTSVAYESIDPGKYERIEGKPSKTIIIDQTKTKVKSPLNFLGLKNSLLHIFTETNDAHLLGLTEKKLDKNCSACKGKGYIKIDMKFLPDITETCEICKGSGYQAEADLIHFKDVKLSQIGDLSLAEAYELFKEYNSIESKLKIALDLGLGYIKLNQPAFSLSGGEIQRLKIVKELSKKSKTGTLFILDEPTIGQHLEDISKLIEILYHIVDTGNSVIVIEHQPNLLASCDWLIELGPGAGKNGGRIIATGPPEEIAKQQTPTAPYLKKILEGSL